MGLHRPTLYHGHTLTLVEQSVMVAIEKHAVDHAGEWFTSREVFPADTRGDHDKRVTLGKLFGRGVVESREITCLIAEGGVWMSLNPKVDLTEHLVSMEVKS